MVKVASCTRCGKVVSAQWASVAECPICGSPVKELEVDLQGRERIPRYLNRIGMVLVVVVALQFAGTLADLIDIPELALLALLGIGIVILFGSIIYQQSLVKESIEKAPQQFGRGRGQRRPLPRTDSTNTPMARRGDLPVKRPITSDPSEKARPRKATKIVQGRR
jgi:hypothetical protein